MSDVAIFMIVAVIFGVILAKFFVNKIEGDKALKANKQRDEFNASLKEVNNHIKEIDEKLKTKKEEYEKNKVIVYGLVDRINSRNKPGPK